MKSFNFFLTLPVMLLSFSLVFGQKFTPIENKSEKKRSHDLHVGDSLPNVRFQHVMNTSANYRDLEAIIKNKKLVVLDFWNSSCSVCIELLPHLQQLQDKFKDQLQIVLVNTQSKRFHDDRLKIEAILKRSYERTGIKIQMPVIYDCTALDKFFPASRLPQEVWLNKKGLVLGVTSQDDLTEKNIGAIIAGKEFQLHTKEDVIVDLDKESLIAVISTGNTNKIKPLFSSLLIKGYVDGLNGNGYGTTTGPNGETMRNARIIANQPLLMIYQTIFEGLKRFSPQKILLDVKDTADFKKIAFSDPSIRNNVFTYEFRCPPVTDQEINLAVGNDLTNMFHTTIKVENREIECYVLKATSTSQKSYTKGGPIIFEENKGSMVKLIRNYPLKDLVMEYSLRYFDWPLIDETGAAINIDLNLPDKLNKSSVIKMLEEAGFTVTREKRLMEVGVITDKTN